MWFSVVIILAGTDGSSYSHETNNNSVPSSFFLLSITAVVPRVLGSVPQSNVKIQDSREWKLRFPRHFICKGLCMCPQVEVGSSCNRRSSSTQTMFAYNLSVFTRPDYFLTSILLTVARTKHHDAHKYKLVMQVFTSRRFYFFPLFCLFLFAKLQHSLVLNCLWHTKWRGMQLFEICAPTWILLRDKEISVIVNSREMQLKNKMWQWLRDVLMTLLRKRFFFAQRNDTKHDINCVSIPLHADIAEAAYYHVTLTKSTENIGVTVTFWTRSYVHHKMDNIGEKVWLKFVIIEKQEIGYNFSVGWCFIWVWALPLEAQLLLFAFSDPLLPIGGEIFWSSSNNAPVFLTFSSTQTWASK